MTGETEDVQERHMTGETETGAATSLGRTSK